MVSCYLNTFELISVTPQLHHKYTQISFNSNTFNLISTAPLLTYHLRIHTALTLGNAKVMAVHKNDIKYYAYKILLLDTATIKGVQSLMTLLFS